MAALDLIEIVNPRTGKRLRMNRALAEAPGGWLPGNPADLTIADVRGMLGDLFAPDIDGTTVSDPTQITTL